MLNVEHTHEPDSPIVMVFAFAKTHANYGSQVMRALCLSKNLIDNHTPEQYIVHM